MNNYLKIKGIILKKTVLNDNDILLTIFTREYGLMKIVYFGINKSTKKEKLSIDIFSYSEFVLKTKKNLENNTINTRMEEVSLIKDYRNLKQNIYSLNFLIYISYILINICFENKSEIEIYERLMKLLDFFSNNMINSKNGMNMYIAFYLIRTIDDLGIYDMDEMENEKIYKEDIKKVYDSIKNNKVEENFEYLVIKLEKYINKNLDTNIYYKKVIFI